MKKLQVLTAVLVLTIFFVMSCEKRAIDTIPSAPKDAAVEQGKTTKKISLQQSSITPNLRDEYCENGQYAVYYTTWQMQNQYRLAPDKYIGVSDEDMSRMRNNFSQYNYNMANTGSLTNVDSLVAIGYSLDNIIFSLPSIPYNQTVLTNAIDQAWSRGIRRFYIDEPIQHWPDGAVSVAAAAPYINAKGLGGTLTISESEFSWHDWYLIGSHGHIGAMIDLALQIYPHPFVSCHTHFDHQWEGTIDPRDQWTYIMGRVPELFKMAWIKTRQTEDEMGLLFGHANNIGINQILLYPFDGPPNYPYIGKVEIAWQQAKNVHWVQQFEKQVTQQWCCPTQNYEPGVCTLAWWTYTGLTGWY